MMSDTTTPITPSRSALLIMDYQEGILSMVDRDQAVPIARNLIRTFREHGGHVGYVRVAFTDADYAAFTETSGMAQSATPERREALHHESPLTQIPDDIAPQDGDIVVRKVRVGAFSTTDLHEQLVARGVDTLVLAGISSSGVVHSTVLDAFDRDYRVIVLEDACFDPDQEVHDFLMRRVFSKRGEVISVRDLHGLLH
jgi:nicotinamidase-related amidase